MDEQVDILKPPTFEKSGVIKLREEAYNCGDWIGTFNLWIVQSDPVPSVVYQMRSPRSTLAPGKLDVTAGGHYQAGETIKDGVREAEEELGKVYDFSTLTYLCRKVYIGIDTKNRERHNIVDICFLKDNALLNSYILEKKEVFAICSCPIEELIKVHTTPNYSFNVSALNNEKEIIEIPVNKDSFPHNFDNYHFKIALLADRFLKEEKHLIY